MTIFIIFLTLISIAHFVYESIIAPSLRMHLRNQLFELRDEIRAIKAKGVEAADEEAFWYAHDGINTLLDRLSWLTLHARVSAMHAYKEKTELQDLVKKRKELLEHCKDSRINDIFLKTSGIVESAFNVNMGAWGLYLIPLAALLGTLGSLKKLAFSIVLTPENQREKLLPKPPLPAL